MKIVFMGSSPFAIPSINYIIENHDILCIYTKQAKPAHRGMSLKKTDSEIFATENNIPIRTPQKFTQDEIDYLKSLNADFIIVASYGIILPSEVLSAAKYPALNLHGSLLPSWRGASPVQYSILNGDPFSGVTLQVMTNEVDAGDILLQKQIKLNHKETLSSLMNDLGLLSASLLKEFFENFELILKNKQSQNSSLATFAPKINKSEYEINFETMDAITIERKIRAFDGNCWSIFGNKRIKIISSEIIQPENNPYYNNTFPCGKIIDKYFTVKTKNGFIRLSKIKPEGKQEMSGEAFLNGNKHLINVANL